MEGKKFCDELHNYKYRKRRSQWHALLGDIVCCDNDFIAFICLFLNTFQADILQCMPLSPTVPCRSWFCLSAQVSCASIAAMRGASFSAAVSFFVTSAHITPPRGID